MKTLFKKMLYGRSVFTLIEILLVCTVFMILGTMLLPSLQEAKQRAKFTRWFAYNRQWSNDPDCVINFNFQEGKGDRLRNSAEGCDFANFNRETYDGLLKNSNDLSAWGTAPTSTTPHQFKWLSAGRWGKFKKALQFNGLNTYVDIPGTTALNFDQDSNFTIFCSAKFDKFALGDGLFSKSGWGTPKNSSAQYDLYCDPTAGKSGKGAFEVDVFTTCVGWDDTDVNLEKSGWIQAVLRYEAPKISGQDGTISCFVNGTPLGPARPTNNSTASSSKSVANCIIGAIGANEAAWGKPIIFPFQGKIDEFVTFKRALSNAEIRGFYEMGKE